MTDASTIQLGDHWIPRDWPVQGEAQKTFHARLANGFFAAYMAGPEIIDVGFRGGFADAVPIFPHAIGVDIDYPGYDGVTLPFADGSIDTVYTSHMLEHVSDYITVIRDWHRVVRVGGFIVCIVPHQFLYEKRLGPPSSWNTDHKRFYTPGTLLREFEAALHPNSYRVCHLADNDAEYNYAIGPESHAAGCYEIELVIKRIAPPTWTMAPPSPRADRAGGLLGRLGKLVGR